MEKYPTYKPSGVEWIGEIPEHWEVKKLKYFGEVTLGKMLTSDDRGGYSLRPYLRSQNIQIEKVDVTDVKEMWFSDSELTRLKLEKGDLLFNEGGDVGRTCLWNEELPECYIQNSVNRVRLLGHERYYLHLSVLYHSVGYYDSLVNRVSIPHLTKEKLEFVKFLTPPLQEQEQIVQYLDEKTEEIDRLVTLTQKKIELLKEKRTSLINHVVTKGLDSDVEMKDSGVEWIGEIPEHWELRRGSTLGNYSKGSGIKKDEVKEVGFPCIRYGEIYTYYDLKFTETKSFIEEGFCQVRVSKGTLLLTGSGETLEDIGKCVVYLGEDEIYVGGDIIILHPQYDIHPLFLSYLINSECIRVQRELFGKGGIIVHIYSKSFREMWFPTPSILEQEQIVQYLDEKTEEIDRLVTIEEKRIETLKEYRQSLISEVVTGKVKVTTT